MAITQKLHSLYRRIYYKYLSTHNPKKLADCLYKDNMGKSKSINWEHPTDLNEKINWLKFYSDTSKWTELADKYAVR